MNLDDELDRLLVHDGHDDGLESDAFADTVMAGLERRRRYRRLLPGLVGSLATAVAVTTWIAMQLPAQSGSVVDLRSILALLVLAALSGVAWIRTEGQSFMT